MIDSFWSRLESLSSPRPWKRIFAPGGDFAWYYIWASFAYPQMTPAFLLHIWKMRCNQDWGQMLNWSENPKSNSEIIWAPENSPWRSVYLRCAVFLYSNGNNPVLLRNSSANLLEVEYPTVWAICPIVRLVFVNKYSAWLIRLCWMYSVIVQS